MGTPQRQTDTPPDRGSAFVLGGRPTAPNVQPSSAKNGRDLHHQVEMVGSQAGLDNRGALALAATAGARAASPSLDGRAASCLTTPAISATSLRATSLRATSATSLPLLLLPWCRHDCCAPFTARFSPEKYTSRKGSWAGPSLPRGTAAAGSSSRASRSTQRWPASASSRVHPEPQPKGVSCVLMETRRTPGRWPERRCARRWP